MYKDKGGNNHDVRSRRSGITDGSCGSCQFNRGTAPGNGAG